MPDFVHRSAQITTAAQSSGLTSAMLAAAGRLNPELNGAKKGHFGRLLSGRDYRTQPRVEWREDKGGLGWFSPGKGRWEPNTGWKPMLH
jgi:hypothetical protein